MKKYLTMSFDDGTTQDARLAEILRKYNLTATFNINTGLLGAETDLFPSRHKCTAPAAFGKRHKRRPLRRV